MTAPLKPLIELAYRKENLATTIRVRRLAIFAAAVFIGMMILHLTR